MYSSNPQQAISQINQAIERAKATPGFDSKLLIALEARLSAIYLRLADGAAAERAARQVIAMITALDGPESHALLQPLMFLQEALYYERKYKEALAQGDENHALFAKILGPQNQLTLAALTMRAETEGAMEDYADAIRDQLALSTIERSLPEGAYLEESNLSDVAMMECHSNHLDAGIAHARQVIAESGEGPTRQPVFQNVATLTLAECMIIRMETPGHTPGAAELAEANRLLASVNVEAMEQTIGLAGIEGNVDAARARLALLKGQFELAKEFADKAAPYLARPEADAYERRAMDRLRAALSVH